jgi:hypothetical protein
MVIKRISSVLLLSLIFLIQSFAQTKNAEKLYSFGFESCDAITARFDGLSIEMSSRPKDKAYFIYYGSLHLSKQGQRQVLIEQKITAYANFASVYLARYRNIDKTRFETIDGGFRSKVFFEIWLVPEGAQKPIPSLTINPKDKAFRNIKVLKKPISCVL